MQALSVVLFQSDSRIAQALASSLHSQFQSVHVARSLDDLRLAIAKHRAWLDTHDQLRKRRERRAAAEVEAIALGTLRARIGTLRHGATLTDLAARVAVGDIDPYTAADDLLGALGSGS